MRGRLIFPFLAEVCRLDTLAMATLDPDGEGPLESGYDPDFKEPVLAGGAGGTQPVRREHPPVRLPAQVEDRTFEELRLLPSGNAPRSLLELVFHFRDLERKGLVDSQTGDALLRPGDRLSALFDREGNLVQAVRTPPGLFVQQARPVGFGLNRARPRRNLLVVTIGSRQQAVRRFH